MRKITKEAVAAFLAGEEYSKDNTCVFYDAGQGAMILSLYSHHIAKRSNKGKLWVCTCGWATKTTMERLNGIPGVSVCQMKFKLYLNGKIWENHSDWTEVK